MPTIAHISDLHLQSGVPERQSQVEPILRKINEMKPDLVVISGDLTDDGWDSIEELQWAKEWLDHRIFATYWALPGNHDVGNFVTQNIGQINQKRIECWREVFVSDEEFEFDHWHTFGINSMQLGMEGSTANLAFHDIISSLIDTQVNEKWIGLFMHTPLFSQSIREEDPAIDYWVGSRQPRQQLWMNIKECKSIKLIGSGHVHQTRLTEVDGVKIVWAPPASGTWVHAPGLPNPPMPEQTGFFLHTLHDDGRIDSELIECAPMLKLYEHNP
ncbi:MAG: metallophosphoesterase [Planctomycetota bacterium]